MKTTLTVCVRGCMGTAWLCVYFFLHIGTVDMVLFCFVFCVAHHFIWCSFCRGTTRRIGTCRLG